MFVPRGTARRAAALVLVIAALAGAPASALPAPEHGEGAGYTWLYHDGPTLSSGDYPVLTTWIAIQVRVQGTLTLGGEQYWITTMGEGGDDFDIAGWGRENLVSGSGNVSSVSYEIGVSDVYWAGWWIPQGRLFGNGGGTYVVSEGIMTVRYESLDAKLCFPEEGEWQCVSAPFTATFTMARVPVQDGCSCHTPVQYSQYPLV